MKKAFSLIELVIVVIVIVFLCIMYLRSGQNSIKNFSKNRVQLEEQHQSAREQIDEIERLRNIQRESQQKILEGGG